MILKQATGYTRLFMMIQSSDHVSGLTGASPAVKISKAGASAVTATNSPATEVDSTNFPGLYKITLNIADVNTLGDLGFHCTAASGDPTDFIDQVQTQLVTDIQLAASGRVLIANSVQQNTALNGFTFPMFDINTGTRKTGLTVTAQRTLGGGGFAPCTNSVTEISGTGIYTINLSASDTNNASIGILFTATGAGDVYLPVYPTQ